MDMSESKSIRLVVDDLGEGTRNISTYVPGKYLLSSTIGWIEASQYMPFRRRLYSPVLSNGDG